MWHFSENSQIKCYIIYHSLNARCFRPLGLKRRELKWQQFDPSFSREFRTHLFASFASSPENDTEADYFKVKALNLLFIMWPKRKLSPRAGDKYISVKFGWKPFYQISAKTFCCDPQKSSLAFKRKKDFQLFLLRSFFKVSKLVDSKKSIIYIFQGI